MRSEFEPSAALFRRAMIERLWHGISACFLLQIVVANFSGYVKSLVDVSVFKTGEHLIVVVSPHSSVEVGLELKAHTEPVALRLAA